MIGVRIPHWLGRFVPRIRIGRYHLGKINIQYANSKDFPWLLSRMVSIEDDLQELLCRCERCGAIRQLPLDPDEGMPQLEIWTNHHSQCGEAVSEGVTTGGQT